MKTWVYQNSEGEFCGQEVICDGTKLLSRRLDAGKGIQRSRSDAKEAGECPGGRGSWLIGAMITIGILSRLKNNLFFYQPTDLAT